MQENQNIDAQLIQTPTPDPEIEQPTQGDSVIIVNESQQNSLPQARNPQEQASIPQQQIQQTQNAFIQYPYQQQYGQNIIQGQPIATQEYYQMGQRLPMEVGVAPIPIIRARQPILITCPYCKQTGMTRCEAIPVFKTYAWVCCLFIFFWPLMCVPLCLEECLGVKSYCQFCNFELGIVD